MSTQRDIKNYIISQVIKEYLDDVIIDVPDIKDNPALRNQIIRGAKTILSGSALKTHQYIKNYMMDKIMRQAMSTDDKEGIDFKKGEMMALKLYEDNLLTLSRLTVTLEKNGKN